MAAGLVLSKTEEAPQQRNPNQRERIVSNSNPTETNIIEGSRTSADLADTGPAAASGPKLGKRRRLRRMITGIALAAAAAGAVGAVSSAACDPRALPSRPRVAVRPLSLIPRA